MAWNTSCQKQLKVLHLLSVSIVVPVFLTTINKQQEDAKWGESVRQAVWSASMRHEVPPAPWGAGVCRGLRFRVNHLCLWPGWLRPGQVTQASVSPAAGDEGTRAGAVYTVWRPLGWAVPCADSGQPCPFRHLVRLSASNA